MATLGMTQAELLDALAKAAAGNAPEHARTAQELADAANVSRAKVVSTLQEFQRQGRLVVHHVRRPRIDGQMNVVPAYTIAP